MMRKNKEHRGERRNQPKSKKKRDESEWKNVKRMINER